MATDYDTTWRVSPEVQRERDQNALALKMEELAADPTNPALQRDVAFTQAQLKGGSYGPPVARAGGAAIPTPAPMPAAPTASPAPGFQYQTTNPRIQGLEQEADRFQGGLEQRLGVLGTEKDIAAQGMQDAFGQPMPGRPKLNQLPTYMPQEYSLENALGFSAIATAFMALAGLRARQPLTAAMSAAGQAMQGYTAGRFAQVRQDLDVFRTQFNAGLAANKQMLDEYQSIINDRNTTRAEKTALWQVAAARWNDEATKGMLRLGQYDRAIQNAYTLLNNENGLRERAREFELGLENKLEVADRRKNALFSPAELTPEAIDNAAAFFILNGRMPIGLSRIGPATLGEIQNRAAEMTKASGMTPQEFAAAGPITKQKLGALLALEKQRNAIQPYKEMLNMNIDVLRQLSDKLERTDSPAANKPILWMQQNMAGDADVAEYLFQVQTVNTEIARVLNNPNLTGQLTDTARQEIREIGSPNMNAQQINRVMARAQADANNRSATLDKQVQKLQAEIRDPLRRGDIGADRSLPGASPQTSRYQEGQTATNPATGQKLRFQNGQWVPQ